MTKIDEAAKRENEQNRRKQKHEDKLADYTSPEEMRKTGGDVLPQQKVVPSQPEPEDNPEYADTKYDGHGGKGK